MPTVMRIGACRFQFYSHEPNEPPHILTDKRESTIKVWRGSLEVARSRGFRAHEINGFVAMIAEHQTALTEAWHEYFG